MNFQMTRPLIVTTTYTYANIHHAKIQSDNHVEAAKCIQ